MAVVKLSLINLLGVLWKVVQGGDQGNLEFQKSL